MATVTRASLLGPWNLQLGVFFLLTGCAAYGQTPEVSRGSPDAVPGSSACPATTAELPASPRYSADDPRLTGDGHMVVLKERRVVGLYKDGALATRDGAPACWTVALGVDREGSYPPSHKVRQGDRRTPEGFYRTSDKPWSNFYGAIAVHYPNAEDAAVGLASGLITQGQHDGIVKALAVDNKPNQNTTLGGEILLHGGGSWSDWTWGCVALDNDDLDALREALPSLRSDVLILP